MEIITILKTIYAVVKGFCIMNWIIGILYKSMSLVNWYYLYESHFYREHSSVRRSFRRARNFEWSLKVHV